MTDLHYLQILILKKLLFATSLTFSELRPSEEIENNKLDFHLKQLQNFKLIIKLEDKYSLTNQGKEFANRMDTESSSMKRHGKTSVILSCLRNLDSQDPEYLVYTRLKQTFYGAQGSPSGKIWWGEKPVDVAIRELKEETNLEVSQTPELYKIEHNFTVDKKTGDILEDKYFFCFRIVDPIGEIVESKEGKYEWVKFSSLEEYITKPFSTKERIISFFNEAKNFDGDLKYIEFENVTDKF